MILSIVVILFIGLIAYIHYVQGLLTGIISAVLAVIAAMMALSYAEPLSNTMNGGKYADTSFGICLVVIFAAVYLIGRTIFDSLVPGNVRLPHLADAIGGAVCGAIAGIFATGVVMIAFQSMPFGPSIGGYARYEIKDKRDVKAVQGENTNRQVDRVVYDEMTNDDLTKGQSGMLLPVDDIVLGMAKRLSNGGALAGERPLESVHPDLLQEFFGQRVGLETGAKHTAFAKGSPAADVKAVTVLAPQVLPKVPAESPLIRPAPGKGEKLTPAPGKKLVVVTVSLKSEAADDDHLIRIATGNVRIVTKTPEGEWKNNYPLGTVQPVGGVWSAWINKPDDFLFLKEGGVHFLFELDDSVFTAAADAKPAAPAAAAEGGKPAGPNAFQLEPGTFIELKRLTRLPLDNIRVKVGVPAEGAQYYPLRKYELYKEKPVVAKGPETPAPAPTPAQPPSQPGAPTDENGWKTAPLGSPVVVPGGNKIPYPIGVGTNDADADVAGAGFDGHLTAKKFDTLNTDTASPESTPAALAKAAPTVQDLFEPEGKRIVQVKFKITSTDPWVWRAQVQRLQVYCEATKTTYLPYGAYGLLKPTAGGADRLFFVFRAASQLGIFPMPQGKLEEVTLIYEVPAGQKVTEARYDGRPNGLPLSDQ